MTTTVSPAIYDTDQTGRILQDVTRPNKDDLYLWLRILEKVKYAYGLDEDLARLRIHSDSWTGNKMKEAKRQWLFYRLTLKLSWPVAFYYFCHYAVFGLIKYLR
ncbi:MAG: hypothetical protein B6241_13830 [Spirochaetaceae bacterium 4572_59]|nr:MAG: hypothetical protein B6241_13830 [Spirochaetaceae bacterium 4572_59]